MFPQKYYNILKTSMIIGIIMTLFIFARYEVMSGDTLLAWPITDSIQNSDHYDSEDLIVEAGKTGNFLLYQILGSIPLFPDNYGLRDIILFIIVTTAVSFAWYGIYYALSGSHIISIFSLLFFMFSDGKLGLNWSIIPMKSFLSFSSIYFIEVFALHYYLKKQLYLSFILLGIASYFHPGSAFSFILILSGSFLIDIKKYNLKLAHVLKPLSVFGIIVVPNILLIIGTNQGRFSITEEYYYIYYNFQRHAYLEDHYGEGYLYTILLIIFLYTLMKRGIFKSVEHNENLFTMMMIGILGSLAWLANLYFFHNLQIIHLYFVQRAFYIIKPIV